MNILYDVSSDTDLAGNYLNAIQDVWKHQQNRNGTRKWYKFLVWFAFGLDLHANNQTRAKLKLLFFTVS